MTTYRYNATGNTVVTSDGMFIPVNVDNRHYRELVEQGVAILPYEPPPPPVLSYRDQRALAYRDELGAEQGDFTKTIGDVIDVLIEQMSADVPEAAKTPAFKALASKVAAIKQRIPKA